MNRAWWERHAHYYLAAAEAHKGNWAWFEVELPQIRRAWQNISQEGKDPELLIAYGELIWHLFEMTTDRLVQELFALKQLQESGAEMPLLHQALQKLDEIARAQAQIQAALGPSISASGERSVAGAIILNSTVITGDHVVLQSKKTKN